MNKNVLMILSLFVIAIFLTGCSTKSQNLGIITSTATQDTNKNPAVLTQTVSDTTPTSNGAVASTSGSVTPASETIKDITIEATNFDFIQTGPAINKGDKVRITFTVTEGRHSLIMSGYNIEFQPLTAGQTESQTFVADKSGTFDYRCNNYCGAGHMDMVGKFVVN
jgi:cytochrome c oxidase subunit II